jgi:hypothetical protein
VEEGDPPFEALKARESVTETVEILQPTFFIEFPLESGFAFV